MVLGAAGGWTEEQEGRPMVGPSGKKLMDVLTEIGVDECYITNAAACIPPDHGEPVHAAVKACRERLEEEIKVVRPKFILGLGNVAVQRMLGRGTITGMAGKEFHSPRYAAWILPAFHPAYLLRRPGGENAWRLDMHRYGRLVRGDIVLPGKPDCRSLLIESRDHLAYVFDRLERRPFTFDFETNAVDWWRTDFRARSVAFAFDGAEAHVLLLNHPENPLPAPVRDEVLHRLRDVRSDATGAHNGLFDALVWYRLTGEIPYVSFDTMVAAHLLDENRPKSLKWIGRALLGWPDWDIDLASKTAAKEGGISLEDFAFYNAADAVATFRLWHLFKEQLRADERLWRYWNTLEMPKLRALIRMVARGIYVDRVALDTRRLAGAHNYVAAKARIPVANPRSAEQVARWLYDDLQLPVLKAGKKHPSTDEPTVKRLAQAHPEARAILPVRKWSRYESTYFGPISGMLQASFDGRYHPDIRSTGTETGRLSSPFHTIPRPTPEDGAFVRSIFSAAPLHTLLEADYAQVEARLAAWTAAGKPATWQEVDPERARMLWAFHEGRDIYREQAAEGLYGDWRKWQQISKNERQVMGKVPVLAMLYRISPDGLRDYAWREYEIDWSKKQATRIWLGFHRLWPEFKLWHERSERVLRARGWTCSVVGRVRRIPEATGYGKAASEAVGSGINMPIQSLASDFTQAAMILLDRVGVPIVGNIHDALLIESGPGFAVRPESVAAVMERLIFKFLEPLGLVLPPGLIQVEIKQGAWGEGKELKLNEMVSVA